MDGWMDGLINIYLNIYIYKQISENKDRFLNI